MKLFKFLTLLLILLLFSIKTNAQWQSIQKSSNTYQLSPSNQFVLNPYRNQLWFVNDITASVLENDGTFVKFSSTDLNGTYSGDQLLFAFTPTHTYYARDYYGLSSFDNYLSSTVYPFVDYQGILRSDSESVFILEAQSNWNYIVYNPSFTDVSNRTAQDMAVKNNYMYVDFGNHNTIAYYTTPGTIDYLFIHTDPDYVGGNYNEMKFSRLSDTLYVAGKSGISYAYNYDFLDTITPNNTIGMPSANVLEIEFDQNDSIWAVFGDAADQPIGLAKLEGSTWTNFYDSNNSPIDFSTFYGMEIDTLGNVWVVDGSALHTLLTPNSPGWLETIELEKPITNFTVYPNPSNGTINLSVDDIASVTSIEITDLSGRLLKTMTYSHQIDLNFKAGQYFIRLLDGDSIIGVEKIVIE